MVIVIKVGGVIFMGSIFDFIIEIEMLVDDLNVLKYVFVGWGKREI